MAVIANYPDCGGGGTIKCLICEVLISGMKRKRKRNRK